MSKPAEGTVRLKGTVMDQVTGFPVFHYHLDRIARALQRDGAMGLLYVNLHDLARIEHDYGGDVYDRILKKVADLLRVAVGKIIRADDLVTVAETQADAFVVFLGRKRMAGPLRVADLEMVSDRMQRYLDEKLRSVARFYLHRPPGAQIGYQLVIHNPLVSPRRLVLRAISDAVEVAGYQRHKALLRLKQQVQEILQQGAITILFQPIMSLHDRKVIGYEALARGPEGSDLHNPDSLFTAAERVDLLFELDRTCRKLALVHAHGLNGSQKIFINTYPTTVFDPTFRDRDLTRFLRAVHIKPENIVLEVSEKRVIENYRIFREGMKYYRTIGFGVGVDDVGTGYSSMEAVTEIRPDYLKADIAIVSHVHERPVKQEFLKALVGIGRTVGARVIAEGIEREDELNTVAQLGAPLGQGFFLGRPQPLSGAAPPASTA